MYSFTLPEERPEKRYASLLKTRTRSSEGIKVHLFFRRIKFNLEKSAPPLPRSIIYI